jgi:hypothetical protein
LASDLYSYEFPHLPSDGEYAIAANLSPKLWGNFCAATGNVDNSRANIGTIQINFCKMRLSIQEASLPFKAAIILLPGALIFNQ